MHGTSDKTKIVSFRLPNEVYAKIIRALNTPTNRNLSVADYCKQVVSRHAFRHSRCKFRHRKDALPRARLF